MAALTKADLAEMLFDDLGLNKREAREIVEMFYAEISEALEKNDNVKISGFGNFELIDKKARPGRNPKTGENVTISERKVVTFRAGNKLRQKIASINE